MAILLASTAVHWQLGGRAILMSSSVVIEGRGWGEYVSTENTVLMISIRGEAGGAYSYVRDGPH